MPTVGRIGPYRVYFVSADRYEPPHVHARRDGASAKFWLDPFVLYDSKGFSEAELRRLWSMIEERKQEFLRAWHDYFDG